MFMVGQREVLSRDVSVSPLVYNVLSLVFCVNALTTFGFV